MKISLIICTYMRPEALLQLLKSVRQQTLYPDEILVIDGSENNATGEMIAANHFDKLKYILVDKTNKGLTKQRNFGLNAVSPESEIIAFLDDDTELLPDYFEVLADTFKKDEMISGVGGVAINESLWIPAVENADKNQYYLFEGFMMKEGQRNVLRNYLGLQSHLPSHVVPEYSHTRASGYPLTGKTYEVDLLNGLSFAFRKRVVDAIRFSEYFEGYGLYEDADFSIRSLKFGKNVINTKLQLYHYHNESGRPNKYKYGKMVVRNGWYVWRVKNPKPGIRAKLKWNVITLLLTAIRYTNVITTNEKKQALTEALGRTFGWLSLIFNKPKVKS